MVYVRLNEHAKALEDASTAVALSPLWTKGHYRQGMALIALDRYDEAVAALKHSLGFAQEEKEKEEIRKALDQAQDLAQFQSYPAYWDLKKKNKSVKTIIETVKANLEKLGSHEFAKAVTSLTASMGTRWRCMQTLVINKDGLILRLQAPNSFLPSDKGIASQLSSGDAQLVQVFLHINKSTTPSDCHQEYIFCNWKQEQTSSVLPSLSNLTSKPLTVFQEKVPAHQIFVRSGEA